MKRYAAERQLFISYVQDTYQRHRQCQDQVDLQAWFTEMSEALKQRIFVSELAVEGGTRRFRLVFHSETNNVFHYLQMHVAEDQTSGAIRESISFEELDNKMRSLSLAKAI